MRLWDSKSGKQLLELNKHQDVVLSAAFMLEDTKVVTISVDKTLILWDIY